MGQTKYSLAKRWQGHLVTARTKYHTYLYHSINHHGPGAFAISVLQEVEAADEAALTIQLNNLEKLWIVLLRSHDEAVGYNMTFGGEGGTPTEAVRRKIGAGNRGRKWTAEHRRKMMEAWARRGPHPNKGKKMSPARVKLMNDARLSKPISATTIAKWSAAGKAQKQSAATRLLRSEHTTGAGNPMFGTHWKVQPDGTRVRYSSLMMGKSIQLSIAPAP